MQTIIISTLVKNYIHQIPIQLLTYTFVLLFIILHLSNQPSSQLVLPISSLLPPIQLCSSHFLHTSSLPTLFFPFPRYYLPSNFNHTSIPMLFIPFLSIFSPFSLYSSILYPPSIFICPFSIHPSSPHYLTSNFIFFLYHSICPPFQLYSSLLSILPLFHIYSSLFSPSFLSRSLYIPSLLMHSPWLNAVFIIQVLLSGVRVCQQKTGKCVWLMTWRG